MKTISINKKDLVEIMVWSYVKGLVEGHNSKKGEVNQKRYKEAKSFIMNTYWYKKKRGDT